MNTRQIINYIKNSKRNFTMVGFTTYLFCLLLVTFQQIIPNPRNTSSKKIIAVKTNDEISIDGILSEEAWQRPGFTELYQQDPDQGEYPSQKSEVWVAYDDEAIYFAAMFHDSSPDSIMARLVRRDFVWGDPSDGVVLYLDSFRDKRNGYFFYVSAAGTLADGVLENDSKFTDISWDAVWEGVPHIDSNGWSVEMKIPYSQLRFKEGDSQVWGINVERFISRRVETDMIAYTPRNESGFASRFPELVGVEGISPSQRFELLPYVTGKTSNVGNNPNDPFNAGQQFLLGAGLDLKAGLGNSLTLDGTINPDFGQVEVDPAIVNLTDVEYTFQERRPFFTEGIGIFRFGRGGSNNNVSFDWSEPNIFYSRRIGRAPQGGLPGYDYADVPNGTHILAAGKISGRIAKDWKIGMVHAVTQREHAEIYADGNHSRVEMEPLSYYCVLRAQRDFDAGQKGIGLLSTFTNRFFNDLSLQNSINKDALVVAADGWTFLDSERTYVLTGWTGVSRVTGNQNQMISLQRSSRHYFQRPDANHINVDNSATSLTGYGGRLTLNKNRGRFTFNTAVALMSPKFELNDLGFGSYSDKINTHFFASYRWNEPTDFYQNTGINAATYLSYDFGGNRTAQGFRVGGYITLPSFYGGNFNFTYNPETLNARRTRGGPLTLNLIGRVLNINLNSDFRNWWVLNVGGNIRNGGDVESYSIFTNFEFKVIPTLTITVGPEISRDLYEAQWIGAYNEPTAYETYGKRYVFAYLDQTTFATDIRVDWIISPKLSFQVYVQPLAASGNYSDFKSLAKAKSFEFDKYGENGSAFEQTTTSSGDIEYSLDPDGDGPADAEIICNPDFNYISFRGNAVLRWEYLPGSAIYLVWTQSREDYGSTGDFYLGRSMNHLFNVKPDNIFMLKVTYWL